MKLLLALVLLLPGIAAAQVPANAWKHRNEMLHSAWRIHGPGAPVAALAAQIHQESGWDCNAVSWAGAKGCTQFMDGTAVDAAARWPADCAPVNQFDFGWSARCRDRYMRSLKPESLAGGLTECDDWSFRFRKYNGGGKHLARDRMLAAQSGADPDDWQAVQPFNHSRKPSAWRENTEYPVRIYRLEPRYASWGRSLGCLEAT